VEAGAPALELLSSGGMEHDLKTTDLLRLIQAEYREIPGLKLTKVQARRLWGIEEHVCEALFTALLTSRFLTETATHAYVLADRR
jgi:hypothetical protein